jgi:arsenate reductase
MPAADRTYNVLFLCTGNSARSVLGEALLNSGRYPNFRGYSAGSHPKGEVHPLTLATLVDAGIAIEGLRSKAWDEFAAPGAPVMDFIFTVCDSAAGEACPLWPGKPATAHWGIVDPAAADGPQFRRRAAFEATLGFLRNRLDAFTSLPLASIDAMTLAARLRGIGHMDGATPSRIVA